MKSKTTRIRRWGIALSLALSSFSATDALAQLAANTYQFSAASGTFTEITGGTAITGLYVDDAISAAINIGFPFNYCGTDYSQLKVCSNGWVTFNTASTSNTWTNDLGNLTTIKPALMPLFDDLAGWGTGADASWSLTGAPPNQVFTIQLKNWSWRMTTGSPPNITLQVKLYQGTNLIEYIYRQEPAAGNGGGATIGIVDNDATPGYLVLNNATAAPTASSSTLTTTITAKPASGQIYRFKPLPPIDMDADSILAPIPFCSNASHPVSARIKNLGTSTINTVDIHWSVNGVVQPTVTYSAAPISNVTTAPANTATVLLGNVFFPDNSPRTIRAWTYQPNGLPDEVPLNDTVTTPVTATLVGVEVHIVPDDTTICQGDNINLNAGEFPNNPIYIWSTGSLDQTINVSQPGNYGVKVQNNMGCFDTDTINVQVHPDPLLNSIAVVDNGGNTFTFNAIGAANIGNYVWNFDDGTANVPGTGLPIAQQVHHFDNPGEYTVSLTLTNDCNEVVRTRLIKIDAPTGIDNLSGLQRELKLYPNPAKDKVTVTSHNGSLKINSIEVYNLMGQRIYQAAVKADKGQIDVAAMAAGIYNVVIETDKGKATKKLEIIK